MRRETKERLITTRPRLMFVTSPFSGLAHYVVHLWRPMSRRADLLYVTQKDGAPDELVQEHIPLVLPVLDSKDRRTIRDVVDVALESNVQVANLHSGTRVKMDHEYFIDLLGELGRLGIRRVLHLHNVATYRATDDDLAAAESLSRHSDAILVGSHRELDFLGQLDDIDGKPTGLMRHGPYDLMARGRFDRESARRFLGLGPDEETVLFFGDLRTEKRLEDLVEAFAVVRARLPRARLLVHCNPRYVQSRQGWLDAVGTLPGVRVQLGYADFVQLEALFRAADVVALPYSNVAASGVLNLARAFRRPVVLTDVFEQAGQIDGTSGYVVPPCRVGLLADALTRVLSLPEDQRRRLGEGWDAAMERDSWNGAADALWKACGPARAGTADVSPRPHMPTRRHERSSSSPP